MRTDELGIFWLILSTLGILTMIFGLRYMSNKENMALIDKGMDPRLKPDKPRPAPFRNLKWGLLLVGAGLGLFLAYFLDNFVLYQVAHHHGDFETYNSGANVPVYFALIAIGGGLGLIMSYRIEKKELLDK
jgi:O-antigen/teichoic acid export membrane protein